MIHKTTDYLLAVCDEYDDALDEMMRQAAKICEWRVQLYYSVFVERTAPQHQDSPFGVWLRKRDEDE